MTNNLKFQRIANEKDIEKKLNPDLAQELKDYFFYFLKVFLTVSIVYLLIRTSVFDVIGISGKSMFPNYDDNDAIYIDQISPRFGEYRRGDVVVLLAPLDNDGRRSLYIKRIIGLPGERVTFEDGRVFIYSPDFPNGVELNERVYLSSGVKTFKKVISGAERFEETILGQDEYFVLGDNRTGSTDSRFFGKINKSDILGREFYRVLPPEKAKFFELPKYNIAN
jgi:signal peptidase I